MRTLYLVIVYNVYLYPWVAGQALPISPCPDVFHYELLEWLPEPGDMALKGVITVESPPPILLKVKLQIPAFLTSKYKGRLELAGGKQDFLQKFNKGTLRKIRFNLYFPADVPLPHLTLIQLNNKVLCSSNPPPRGFKTDFSLEYSLKTVVTNNPPIVSNSNSNNNKNYRYQNYDWLFQKPGERVPQKNQPSESNKRKYSQNPFMKFPQSEARIPTAFDRPKNQRNDNNIPAITFVDTPRNPYQSNSNANALISDSQKLFQPVLNVRPNPNPPQIQTSETCGISFVTNPLIVNGTGTKRGEWPWLVALFKRIDLGVLFVCGSTLISDQYILTAAHCVKDFSVSSNNAALLAYIGRFNLWDWGEHGSELKEISDIFIHPDYEGELMYSDIALLKLQQSVTFSPYVYPACIWSGEEDLSGIVGSRGIVVGWGKDGKGNKVTGTPNMVTLPIVSKESCLDSKINFKFYASNKTFCAGSRDGSGPCNGDSGGGLLMPRTDLSGNTRWYLRGIVSLSLPKSNENVYECDLSQYLIFTDVAKFRNWLADYIPPEF